MQALKAEGAVLSKKINGSYRFNVDDGAWVLDLKVGIGHFIDTVGPWVSNPPGRSSLLSSPRLPFSQSAEPALRAGDKDSAVDCTVTVSGSVTAFVWVGLLLVPLSPPLIRFFSPRTSHRSRTTTLSSSSRASSTPNRCVRACVRESSRKKIEREPACARTPLVGAVRVPRIASPLDVVATLSSHPPLLLSSSYRPL